MELKNCRRCGRVYQKTLGKVCPACMEEMDQEFIKVREFIYGNPSANVSVIAEKTGVPERTILQFLRDGRLEFYKVSESLECKRCGVWIKSGIYCDECIKELKEFTTNKDKNKKEIEKRNRSKMYTFDNIKRKY